MLLVVIFSFTVILYIFFFVNYSRCKDTENFLTARKKVHACAFLVHDITFCDFRSTIKYGENGNVTPDLKVFCIFAT